MNIDYLKTEIIPQRKKEIEEGANLGTAEPIYVVIDLQENYCEGHSGFTLITTVSNKEKEFGYIDEDLDYEEKEFKAEPDGMKYPTEVTRFFTDRYVAFFLTSKAAHEYMQYQSHNLSDNAFVYVFHCGYRNNEMYNLLKGE